MTTYTVIGISGQLVTSDYTNAGSPTHVEIADGITSIGAYCFYAKTNLLSVIIPSSVTTLGDFCFGGTNLTSVDIPNGVTTFAAFVFMNCRNLTSVTISDSVTYMGIQCFYGCSSLTSINLSNSLLSLRSHLFNSCTSLASITIPSSVTGIQNNCFSNCTSLASITIPTSVTSIGSECFSNCTSLVSITIPNSVTTIGIDCFTGCSILTYVIYDNITYTYLGSYSNLTTSINDLLSSNITDWSLFTGFTYQIVDPPVSGRYASHKYGTSNIYGIEYSGLAKNTINNYCWATYNGSNTAFINNGLDTFIIPTGLDDNGSVQTVPRTPEHNDPGIFLEMSFEKSIVSGIVLQRRGGQESVGSQNGGETQLITSYRVKEYDGTSWNLVTPENPYTETSDRFTGTISSDGFFFNRVSKFLSRIETTKVRIYPTSGETYLSGHFGIEIEDPSVNNFTISPSLVETTAIITLTCNFALTATDVSDNLILTPPGCGTISNITNRDSGINWTATFTPIYATNCSLRFSLTSPYTIDENINFSIPSPEYSNIILTKNTKFAPNGMILGNKNNSFINIYRKTNNGIIWNNDISFFNGNIFALSNDRIVFSDETMLRIYDYSGSIWNVMNGGNIAYLNIIALSINLDGNTVAVSNGTDVNVFTNINNNWTYTYTYNNASVNGLSLSPDGMKLGMGFGNVGEDFSSIIVENVVHVWYEPDTDIFELMDWYNNSPTYVLHDITQTFTISGNSLAFLNGTYSSTETNSHDEWFILKNVTIYEGSHATRHSLTGGTINYFDYGIKSGSMSQSPYDSESNWVYSGYTKDGTNIYYSTVDENTSIAYDGEFFQFEFPFYLELSKMYLLNSGTSTSIREMTILGSNDGTKWEYVYNFSKDVSYLSETFNITTKKRFKKFRFVVQRSQKKYNYEVKQIKIYGKIY